MLRPLQLIPHTAYGVPSTGSPAKAYVYGTDVNFEGLGMSQLYNYFIVESAEVGAKYNYVNVSMVYPPSSNYQHTDIIIRELIPPCDTLPGRVVLELGTLGFNNVYNYETSQWGYEPIPLTTMLDVYNYINEHVPFLSANSFYETGNYVYPPPTEYFLTGAADATAGEPLSVLFDYSNIYLCTTRCTANDGSG